MMKVFSRLTDQFLDLVFKKAGAAFYTGFEPPKHPKVRAAEARTHLQTNDQGLANWTIINEVFKQSPTLQKYEEEEEAARLQFWLIGTGILHEQQYNMAIEDIDHCGQSLWKRKEFSKYINLAAELQKTKFFHCEKACRNGVSTEDMRALNQLNPKFYAHLIKQTRNPAEEILNRNL